MTISAVTVPIAVSLTEKPPDISPEIRRISWNIQENLLNSGESPEIRRFSWFFRRDFSCNIQEISWNQEFLLKSGDLLNISGEISPETSGESPDFRRKRILLIFQEKFLLKYSGDLLISGERRFSWYFRRNFSWCIRRNESLYISGENYLDIRLYMYMELYYMSLLCYCIVILSYYCCIII